MNENLNKTVENNPFIVDYARKREELLKWMGWDRYDEYEYLLNFLTDPSKLFKEDEQWLAEAVKAAEWNNDDFRRGLIHVAAELESSLAYYITIFACNPDDNVDLNEETNTIIGCLETVADYTAEIRLLVSLIYVEHDIDESWRKLLGIIDADEFAEEHPELDCSVEDNSREYSEDLVIALGIRDMIMSYLKDLYEKRSDKYLMDLSEDN